MGCGSGQRFVRGQWEIENIDAEHDAVMSGKSATFTLDMKQGKGQLWISVQGQGKTLVASDIARDVPSSTKVHPAAFLRTGDRQVNFGPICGLVGFHEHRVDDALTIIRTSPVDAMAFDRCGRTPLSRACESAAHIDIVRVLIATSSESATMGRVNGRLPLHLVCTTPNTSLDVFNIVYQAHEAAISIPDRDGWLPLHLCMYHDCTLDIIRRCLQLHPTSASTADVDGQLPLHLALRHGRPLSTIEAIMDAYPEAIAVPDNEGNCPLHTVCFAAATTTLDVVTYILKADGEVAKRKNRQGRLPLHLACDGGANVLFIRLLLDSYPLSVKEKDMNGRSPLSAACERLLPLDVVTALLDAWPGAARERNANGLLPLHVACCHNASVEVVRLLLGAYGEGSLDVVGGKLPIIIAVEKEASADVIAELLPLSVERIINGQDVVVQSGKSGKIVEYGSQKGPSSQKHRSGSYNRRQSGQSTLCGWTTLLRDGRDDYATAVASVLDRYENYIQKLASATDEHGRKAVEIATPLCKSEILKRLFLCGRYELKDGPPLHQSMTSRVHYAIDHDHMLDGPVEVVLKFMKNRDQFLREIKQRESCLVHMDHHTRTDVVQTDIPFVDEVTDHNEEHDTQQYIVPIQFIHDSDNDDNFHRQILASGLGSHPYLLVMPAGDRCLSAIIDHEREVDGWNDEVIRCTRQLATALAYIHDRGCIHGDLKPRNIVRVGKNYMLIDMDASASFEREECAGVKVSSAFAPPELVDALQQHPDTLPFASPTFDAWGLGATLFQMVTGQTLLHADASDNAADGTQLALVQTWDDNSKSDKLTKVTDRCAKNLLSLLLHREPTRRPRMCHVLSHPYLTRRTPCRMVGDDADYDVFISYRVASDAHIAEKVYDCLTAMGIKVWWDRKCLNPGESWEEGFCRGLMHSHIFLPILSRHAINHPTDTRQSFANLLSNSPCDNVLLEYVLANEMEARGFLHYVYPLFVGELSSSDGTFCNYFGSGCHPRAPNISVDDVNAKFAGFLDLMGLGCPFLDTADTTVSTVLSCITKHQGSFMEGSADVAMRFEAVQTDVGKMLRSSGRYRSDLDTL